MTRAGEGNFALSTAENFPTIEKFSQENIIEKSPREGAASWWHCLAARRAVQPAVQLPADSFWWWTRKKVPEEVWDSVCSAATNAATAALSCRRRSALATYAGIGSGAAGKAHRD